MRLLAARVAMFDLGGVPSVALTATGTSGCYEESPPVGGLLPVSID